MRRSQLFHVLSDDELAEFYPFLYLRSFQKNEVIFFRDDPAQAVYLIKEGEVELNIDIQGEFELLTRVSECITLGSEALIARQRRLYNAIVCSDEAWIYVIPQVSILEIFQREVRIRAKLMQALAHMYVEHTRHVFNAYRNVYGFFDLGQAYTYSFQQRTKKED